MQRTSPLRCVPRVLECEACAGVGCVWFVRQRGEGDAKRQSVLGRFGLLLLVGPLLLVLPTSEPLVVVSLSFEQLLEVRLTVKLPLQGCVGPQAEFCVAVLAAEAGRMKDLLVCHQSLHGIHSFLAGRANLPLDLKAKRLGALHRLLLRGCTGVHRCIVVSG